MRNLSSKVRIAVSALAAVALFAISTLMAAPRGNETKGRHYFRQTCRDCHIKGAKGKEVNPLTKTQAQWKTYLTKGQHDNGKEALNKVVPEAQLLDLQTFLVNHAADSPQPETCGK